MPHRILVGAAEIIALTDIEVAYPLGDLYPGVAPDRLEPYRDLLNRDGQFVLNFSCHLVRADGKTVLIDTAWGPAWEGHLMEELSQAGVRPEEVDVVTFTHLHIDHYGWNLERDGERWKPRFPNARYVVNQADWDYFAKGESVFEPENEFAAFQVTMAPLPELGVLDLFTGNHTYSASLSGEHTPGHTPGHMSFVVSSQGEKCFILGDVALSPVDAHEEEWNLLSDEVPEQAIATRKRVLGQLEAEGTLVAANHFPAPGFGRFTRSGERRAWVEAD